eukprot:4256554-Heterocapsa_arctica.AAC.1
MTDSMASSTLLPLSPLFPGNGVWSPMSVRRMPFLRRCSLRLRQRLWKAAWSASGIPDGMLWQRS